MRKKNIIALVLFVLMSCVNAAKLEDVTILVPSCDKYSSLWKPFFTLLFNNWPSLKNGENSDVPIILIANEKKYDDPRVKVINIKNERTWSTNVKEALKQIKTKYVMILLEDYIVNKVVDEDKFIEKFEFVKNQNFAYLQLSVIDHSSQTFLDKPNLPVLQFAKHSKYRTSLQACIWNVEALDWLIKDDEGVWDFEIGPSVRSEGMRQPFYAAKKDLISYLNASHHAVLQTEVLDYIKSKGIETEPTLPTSDQFSSKWKEFKFGIRSFVYWKLYLPAKNFVKSIT